RAVRRRRPGYRLLPGRGHRQRRADARPGGPVLSPPRLPRRVELHPAGRPAAGPAPPAPPRPARPVPPRHTVPPPAHPPPPRPPHPHAPGSHRAHRASRAPRTASPSPSKPPDSTPATPPHRNHTSIQNAYIGGILAHNVRLPLHRGTDAKTDAIGRAAATIAE